MFDANTEIFLTEAILASIWLTFAFLSTRPAWPVSAGGHSILFEAWRQEQRFLLFFVGGRWQQATQNTTETTKRKNDRTKKVWQVDRNPFG